MSAGEQSGWLVYACRTPFCIEVAESIWRRGEKVRALVDNLPPAEEGERRAGTDPAPIGAPVLRPEEITAAHHPLAVTLPLITPGHRIEVEAEARRHGLLRFPPLIDPTAIVARSAAVAEGSVVNAAAVVAGGAAIGRFVHLNRGASVGHHDTIEDYTTIGPGCVLAGHVRVRRGAFLGAGAVCAPAVTIGENAVVGAGAVVVDDLAPGAVAVGNPARAIREGVPGYGGVSVPAATR